MNTTEKQKKNKHKKLPHKVIYYENELTDDFLGTNIKQKTVDKNFKYVHKNIIWRFFSFLLYYIIAIPVLSFYVFLMKRVKFVNRKALKKVKKQGCFLYGNHTGVIDAYTPSILCFPRRNKIIVSPDAVSIKGIKNIVQMLGGVPVPNDVSGMMKFTKAVNWYNKKGYNVTIYPEAHIWPYYTGVRPFKDTSFGYPVSLNAPVVAFFTAYSKPKGLFSNIRKTNVTIYVSDPIYPDLNKTKKEAQKELRDKVYAFMKDCSEKYSDYSYIEYKHISEKPTNDNSTTELLTDKDFE